MEETHISTSPSWTIPFRPYAPVTSFLLVCHEDVCPSWLLCPLVGSAPVWAVWFSLTSSLRRSVLLPSAWARWWCLLPCWMRKFTCPKVCRQPATTNEGGVGGSFEVGNPCPETHRYAPLSSFLERVNECLAISHGSGQGARRGMRFSFVSFHFYWVCLC